MEKERNVLLEEGDSIYLPSLQKKNFNVRYNIKKCSTANTMITYLAEKKINEEKQYGYLMEFYPIEKNYGFERNANNQLIATNSIGKFKKQVNVMQNKVQNMLQNKKGAIEETTSIEYYCAANSKTDEVFFEELQKIYSEDGIKKANKCPMSTFYVWVVLPDTTDLEKYVQDLYQNTELDAYKKLVLLLEVFEVIAQHIKNLEDDENQLSKLSLSDIMMKCTDNNMRVDKNSISLGTVDMLLREKQEHHQEVTPFFKFGELFLDALSMEYKSVEKTKIMEDEQDLSFIIEEMDLIKQSEGYSKPYFKYRMLKFLKKCFASTDNEKFNGILELQKDFSELKKLLNSTDNKNNVQTVGSGKVAAVQHLLYEKPIYKYAEDKHMHILVVGAGSYCQLFVDQCMQSAQMPNWKVTIDVFSNRSVEDKESYMAFRPELKEFVRVNGEYNRDASDEYASLNFLPLDEGKEFLKTDVDWNVEIANSIIENSNPKRYHYIFIAVGDDELNRFVAEAFDSVISGNCQINYAVDYKKNISKDKKHISKDNIMPNEIFGVWMKRDTLPEIENQSLEQMAFNAHLSWQNTLNVDEKEFRKKFLHNSYDYASSMAFALSIKYKLYSMGIDMMKCENVEAAAEKFYSNILKDKEVDEAVKKAYEELVASEHRRWVLEKILAGWTSMKKDGEIDYERCVEIGAARDEKNKQHACIVHSTSARKLQSSTYSAEMWNTPNALDKELDELDQVSVNLHRKFGEKVEALKNTISFDSGMFKLLENQVPQDNEKVQHALKQFQFYIKNLFNGAAHYASHYKYYEKELLKSLDRLPNDVIDEIKMTLSSIHKMFVPVLAWLSYQDYKKNDDIFINKIPFIMTYHKVGTLAIAFVSKCIGFGNNNQLFSNVASAMVLNPDKIHYVYYYTSEDNEREFIRALERTLEYLENRGIRCQVDIDIAYDSTIYVNKINGMSEKLDALKTRYTGYANSKNHQQTRVNFAGYKLIKCENIQKAMWQLILPMTRKRNIYYNYASALFLEDSNAENDFKTLLKKNNIPCFQYLPKNNKKIEPITACEFLKYIENTATLRVMDIFKLAGTIPQKYTLPEYNNDYENLWQIYCGCYLDATEEVKRRRGGQIWNRLCEKLSQYDKEEKKELFSVKFIPKKNKGRFEQVYYVPNYTYQTYKKLLKVLNNDKIINSGKSYICKYTSESCKLQISSEYQIKNLMDNILQYQHYYIDENNVDMKRDEDIYYVTYNNPYVIKNENFYDSNEKALLSKLDKHGYIRIIPKEMISNDLKEGISNPYGFVYSSERIKKLLTTAGALFEVYTYYEVLKTGYFDDVVTSFEFKWSGGAREPENELDLVLTKKFQTIVVECKSVKKLEQDFYPKLYALAGQFGINVKSVVAANLYQGNEEDDDNQRQINRGNNMGMITLNTEEDIENIGTLLVDVMEGRRTE